MYVLNRTRGTYLGVNIKLANSLHSRLLGLYAHRHLRLGDGVLLVPCNSVQTIGMRCAIDVVFLDAAGRVVRLYDEVRPGRVFLYARSARAALELTAGAVSSSETQTGDQIEFVKDLDTAPFKAPLDRPHVV